MLFFYDLNIGVSGFRGKIWCNREIPFGNFKLFRGILYFGDVLIDQVDSMEKKKVYSEFFSIIGNRKLAESVYELD